MAETTNWVEIDKQRTEIIPGKTLYQHLQQHDPEALQGDNPVVITSINGRRTSLATSLWGEERLRLIRLNDNEAHSTIQNTVLFILAVATEQLFPDEQIWADFSYGNGTYCALTRDKPLTASEIKKLEKRMWHIVEQNQPLLPQVFGVRALLKMNQRDKRRGFATARYVRRNSITLFRMNGANHLHYGRQLPTTGAVKSFKLIKQKPGLILLTNLEGQPDQVPEYTPQPKLLKTMLQYANWTDEQQIQDIGSMNQFIVDGRTSDLIQVCEGRHAKVFVEAAQQVADLPKDRRLILVAGPSSSGKTSFAKRLEVQLRVLGFKPFALSLDNYFVDRNNTPLDDEGDYDYEALEAIQIDLFNKHLLQLMNGEAVRLQQYNFHSGKSALAAHTTQLTPGQPLIVEGIHALNPSLTPGISTQDKLHIYVSALCHMNIDNFSSIKTADTRLYRRIVRDAKFRGYTAAETLFRWPKVRSGENKHIFPFQNNADIFFNSGLAYELAVLKLWAEPRLAAVDLDDPNYGLARSLIDLLSLLLPIDASQVPPTSLLREFIGGSSFSY